MDHIQYMLLGSDNDVVDGDVDELDEEPNEAHEAKPDGRGDGDLREFFPEGLMINFNCQYCLFLVIPPVRLGAPLHQSDGVLAELLQGLDLLRDLVHCALLRRFICRRKLLETCRKIQSQNSVTITPFHHLSVLYLLSVQLTTCLSAVAVCCVSRAPTVH